MSDDTKDRGDPRDDPAHQTMPPELRPFAKPVPIQPLVPPENEARFNAAISALKLLNGGPNADPFYVDPRNDPALASGRAPESVKASASALLPSTEATVLRAVPERVVIAEAGAPVEGERVGPLEGIDSDPTHGRPADHCGEVDVRPFRGVRRRAGERTVEESAPAAPASTAEPREASPWAKDAPSETAEESARPAALRPPEPTPSGEDDASASASPSRTTVVTRRPSGRGTASIAVAIAVIAAIGALALLFARRPHDDPAHGAAPAVTTSASVAPPVPAPGLSSPATASATSIATATVASGAAPPGPAPQAPPAGPKREHPHADAGVAPNPVVTAAPSAAPAAPPPTPPAPTLAPVAPTPTSSAFGGTRVFGD